MILFDYICLAIIVLLSARAGIRGFLKEAVHKIGITIGAFSAFMFTGKTAVSLSEIITQFNLGRWGLVIIAVLLFIIGYGFTRFLLWIFKDLIERLHGEVLDHVLGGAFGVIEGAVLVIIAIRLLRIQSVVDPAAIFTGSLVVDRLTPILLWMMKFDVGSYVSEFKGVL